jgi:tRNA1(Val) A37 N6-methylase TrmN6
MSDELTQDQLTAEWTILQRRRGHRHSTDDLLTGWYAAEKTSGHRQRLLDLGAGIGTVGLLLLWRSPGAKLTAIEVQAVSFALLEENVARNTLRDRVRAIHGDLRHVRLDGETFDVVTGSPPYFDPKDGIVSADSQRAHARFELRGDVRDYCVAARAALARGGRFVFCFPTNQRARAEAAIAEAELMIVTSRDVVPRDGIAPLFSLFSCRHREDAGGAPVLEAPYVVRDERGEPTSEHARSRATFGFT